MDAQEGLPLRSHGLVATCIHGGGARFFFADHLGSPRVLTNGLGTLTGKHHYFAYGKEYAPGQDDEQQYKFTGHQRDTHGLSDYMRGRTCAYPLQRFMSVDPGRDGWNLYAYVGGNPIKYLDPTGNERAQIQLDRDTNGNERAQIQLDRDTNAFLAGEISQSQFTENVAARGKAAFAAVSVLTLVPEGIAVRAIATRAGGRLSGRSGRFLGKIFGKGSKRSNQSSLKQTEEVVTRQTRQIDSGVRVTRSDGSVIDVTKRRVKEYVPNNHPEAPSGTLQRVKFKDSQPGSKGFKRDPTAEDLKLLDDALER